MNIIIRNQFLSSAHDYHKNYFVIILVYKYVYLHIIIRYDLY